MLLAPVTALPALLVWVALGALAVAGAVPAAVAAVLALVVHRARLTRPCTSTDSPTPQTVSRPVTTRSARSR